MDDMNFTAWLMAGAGSAVTALTGWALNRKKEAKELALTASAIKTAEIENVDRAIVIWRRLAEDMRKQVDELRIEIHEMKKQVNQLLTENDTLKDKIEVLHRENIVLADQIKNK